MKYWLADSLRRLAWWIAPGIELPYATAQQVEKVATDLSDVEVALHSLVDGQKAEIAILKKQVENISLLVGFSRGIKTPGGR